MKSLAHQIFGFIAFIVCLGGASPAQAQMAAAARVSYDIDQSLSTTMSPYKAWKLLNDEKEGSTISNGYVKSIVIEDAGKPMRRLVIFSDGSSRKEVVTQVENDNHLLVYGADKDALNDNPIYKGLDNIVFVVTLKEKDDNTVINWKVKVTGKKATKIQAVEQLKKEIEQYMLGFKKLEK